MAQIGELFETRYSQFPVYATIRPSEGTQGKIGVLCWDTAHRRRTVNSRWGHSAPRGPSQEIFQQHQIAALLIDLRV